MSKNTTTAKQIKDAFLKEQVRKEEHAIPETDIKVWVHELTSYQLERWREMCRSEDDNARRANAAALLQMALHDAEGGLVFQENEITILAGGPSRMIEPLVKVVLRLSGYGTEGDAAILKNLRKILGVAGLSDLLGSSDAASGSSIEGTPQESCGSST